MTPELVRQDLAVLLRSDDIDSAVKGVILEQATDYAEVAGPRGLNELARFATRHGSELPLDIVQKIAEVGVSAEQIVLLLNPHLTSISRDQLFTVLRTLGGDYLSLTEVGRTKPRVPNTPADRMLLERLKGEGIVSRYDEKGAQIKVHKKYK